MGLLGDMFKGLRIKEPVSGQAQVVSCTGYHGDGVWQNCRMQLVVSGDGVEATSVEHSELIHNRKWPTPGMALPATIDRSNPQRFKIDWGAVKDSRELAAANAEAMAAAMRGEVRATPATAHLTPEQRAKLQRAGIDPEELARLRGFGPRFPPQEAVADSDDGVDDQLARLAKLGQLRDSGVLTPEEFEQQKRRILEG